MISGMNAGPSARCAVGLLTWNGQADIAACARSLLAQDEPGMEIHWIDNASTDSTVSTAREAAPSLPEPRLLNENVGFCGGHNLGFSLSCSRYYLALNQDAVIAPEYVRTLCDWMDAEPRLAMVSGLILETGAAGLESVAELAVSPTRRGELDALARRSTIYSAGLAMGRGRFPFELGMGRPARDSDFQPRFVPAVTGAAMILRREAVESVAARPGEVFPPEFFAYFEEVDLALRLAAAGWKCGVHGAARAWHAARGQGGAGRPRIRAHYFKNHWLMILRNGTAVELMRDAPAILKNELIHYGPRYLREPAAALRGLAGAIHLAPRAMRQAGCLNASIGIDNAIRARREFFDESRNALRARNESAKMETPAPLA